MNDPPLQHPPWTPAERLELLTEVLRAVNYPPEELLPVVRVLPYPPFEDMPLPRGRSLNQCRMFYNEYVQSQPPIALSRPSTHRLPPRTIDLAGTKRPLSMEGPSSAPMMSLPGVQYKDIQPRPPGLDSFSNQPSSLEPPRKKRGRPTKAESEQRRELARARGQSIPTMRRIDMVQAGPSSSTASLAATQAAQAVMAPLIHTQSLPEQGLRAAARGESSRKRSRSRSEQVPGLEDIDEDDVSPANAPSRPHHQRTTSRVVDILTHHPDEGPSTFRAPRGGE